jgi:hypothetical protein
MPNSRRLVEYPYRLQRRWIRRHPYRELAARFCQDSANAPFAEAQKPTKTPARSREFLKRIQSDLGCPAPRRKIFLFSSDPNHRLILGHPTPREGRIMIVTNVGRDAVDATASGARRRAGRKRLLRTVKPCGPDAPTLASSAR